MGSHVDNPVSSSRSEPQALCSCEDPLFILKLSWEMCPSCFHLPAFFFRNPVGTPSASRPASLFLPLEPSVFVVPSSLRFAFFVISHLLPLEDSDAIWLERTFRCSWIFLPVPLRPSPGCVRAQQSD